MTKSKKEKRKYARYDTEVKIFFRVTYDIKTKVEFQIKERDKKALSKKYPAESKNVSVEGLRFSSKKKLEEGDIVYLEVYLPTIKEPIYMKGEVRWSHATSLKEKKEHKFDTGVELMTVNGRSVRDSVYFDETNKVFWSTVLDSVLGSFRKIVQRGQIS